MIQLYINDLLVDLDDSVSFPITYSIEDIINPTVIKTPYSKTVSLPNTANNNKIFGFYFKVDKQLTNLDISPNQRIPYILMWGSTLIMKGYLRLTNITNNRYEVNLYSDTGEMLRKLSEKTLLNVMPTDIPLVVNKSKVANMFQTHPADTTLDPTGVSRYLWWYTFSPSYQGKYDNFVSDKLENDSGQIITLPKEVDEMTQRDFRSYNQKPGIWLNKLVSRIALDAGIELHSDFHNNANPYWNNAFVCFPKLIPNKTVSVQNNELLQNTNFSYNADTNMMVDGIVKVKDENDTYNIINPDGYINLSTYPSKDVVLEYDVNLSISFNHTISIGADGFNYYLGPNSSVNPGYVRISIWIEGQTNKVDEFLYFGHRVTDNKNTQCLGINKADTSKIVFYDSGGNGKTTEQFKVRSVFSNNISSNRVSIKVEALSNSFVPMEWAVIGVGEQDDYKILANYGFNFNQTINASSIGNINFKVPEIVRSGHTINFNNIIPADMNAADFLLEYIKMFGLSLYKNDKDKFVISTRNTFYSNYNILDWNSKLDLTKEITLNPVNYESKYYTLNYSENSTTHYKNYTESYNIPFSGVKINTNFEFNPTPVEFYKSNATCPLISQEYDLYYDANDMPKWYRKDQIAPCFSTLENGTNERQKSDFKYTYLFREGVTQRGVTESNFPIELWDRTPENYMIITDDTNNMITKDEYYYCYDYKRAPSKTGSYKTTVVDGYGRPLHPYVRAITKDGNYSLDWGKSERYYYEILDNEYNPNGTLYSRFYEKYLEDRFDVNTKVLTAYFLLKYEDIKDLKFNNFIYLRGVYWVINSIIDYDITNQGTTKVELVRVQDIDNYINGQNLN